MLNAALSMMQSLAAGIASNLPALIPAALSILTEISAGPVSYTHLDVYKRQQIHGGDHGKPKQHPYGEHGEHIHIYVWQQGEKRPKRTVRNVNAEERIVYKDILGDD